MESEPQGSFDCNLDLIGSATSTEEIIDALARRGCPNLTTEIDPGVCSGFPVAGGGFCDVYRSALYDGTHIAIKSLRIYDRPAGKGDSDKGKTLKRAARELYCWSKLQHQNILPLMGLAIFRSYLSMVSPWAENGNIASYIESNPNANRIKLCVDISEGLFYLHTNETSHGDLKAANVMVSPEGTAIIADFGNAQLKEITLKFTDTTKSGLSVRWAAPELLLRDGGPQMSKEADVYAYGMTVLEILTGKIPFDGISDNRVICLVAYEQKVPTRPDIHISDNLWDLLNSCWIRDPSKRPGIARVGSSLKSLSPPNSYSASAPLVYCNTMSMPSLIAQPPQVPTHTAGNYVYKTRGLYAPIAGPDDPARVSPTRGGDLGNILCDGDRKRWQARSRHSGVYKRPFDVPSNTPFDFGEEPKSTVTKDEAQREAGLGAQTSVDPIPSASVRVVNEKRDPEALQITLFETRPISFLGLTVPETAVGSGLGAVTEAAVVSEHVAREPEQSPIPPTVFSQEQSPVSPTSVRSLDASILNADFVEDVSIVDGQVVSGGAEFTKCWKMCNNGPAAWPNGTTISFVGGDPMLIQPGMIHWAVTGDFSPGQEIDVEVDMKAPEEPGCYTSYWRLKTPKGQGFGTRVWCEIVVDELERAGSSGSSETSASGIVVPIYAPRASAALINSATTSPSFHSATLIIRTPSSSNADTTGVQSLESIESDNSNLWEEVRCQTSVASEVERRLDETYNSP